MARRILLFLSYLFVLPWGTPLLLAADDCDAILEQGIRNVYQTLRTSDFHGAFQNSFCRTSENSSQSGDGTSIGGQAGLYALNFNKNNSEMKEARASDCGSGGSFNSDAKYESAMEFVADPNVVSAWKECKANRYGILILAEVHGTTITLEYKFRAAGSVTQATLSGNPIIQGARCVPALTSGTVIDTGGKIQLCTRDKNDPVNVVINSNFQGARAYIPPEAPPQVQQPSRSPPTSKPPADKSVKSWHDRTEFNLYDTITKTKDPNTRLQLLHEWESKYPQTDFQEERNTYYRFTYQQISKMK